MYRAKHKTGTISATNITTSYINPKPFSPLRDNENESSDEQDDADHYTVHFKQEQQPQHQSANRDDNDSENNENSTESICYTNNVSNFKNLNKIKMTSVSAPLVHSNENTMDVS